MIPTTIGDTSAASTATIASSSNATPSALSGLPQPQQGPTTANPGERRQVPVAEAVADLGGLTEGGVRGRGVALAKALDRDRYEQIPLLHTVQLAVVQQPPGPGEPAATAGQLAPVQQGGSQPERTPDGALRAAQPQPLVMRASPDVVAVGVPTQKVCGRGEPLQILRRQRSLPVGRRQLHEGIRPRPPPEGLPAPIQCVSRAHSCSSPPGRPPRTSALRPPAAPLGPYLLLQTSRRRRPRGRVAKPSCSQIARAVEDGSALDGEPADWLGQLTSAGSGTSHPGTRTSEMLTDRPERTAARR